MSNIDFTMYNNKAKAIWDALSSQERSAIRFGLLPDQAIQAAVNEGFDATELTAALLRVADSSGGMVS